MRLCDCCRRERRAWNLRDRWMAARRPTDSGDTVEKARRGLAPRAVKLALQTFAKIAVPMVTRMDSTRRTSMLRHSSIRRLVLLGLLLAGAFSAFPAAAQCCPGDGNGAPKTAVGLGHRPRNQNPRRQQFQHACRAGTGGSSDSSQWRSATPIPMPYQLLRIRSGY